MMFNVFLMRLPYITGLFDNIPYDLLLTAVYKHTDTSWVNLYIERWLTAPIQMPEGELVRRDKGTPQGGVVSLVLSNLFYLINGVEITIETYHGVDMLMIGSCIAGVNLKP